MYTDSGQYMRSSGIPVVRNFGQEYNTFCSWIEQNISESSLKPVSVPIRRKILKLKHEIRNHSSFDVLAKKYYLDDRQSELETLKFALSMFLSWIETYIQVDKRYDELLVTFIDKDNRSFKKNFNIISWNYDLQIERAYSSIYKGTNLNNIKSYLNVSDLQRGYGAYNHKDRGLTIKLNGDYSTYKQTKGEEAIRSIKAPFDDKNPHETLNDSDQNRFIRRFLELLKIFHDGYIPQIDFAWEANTEINEEVVDMLSQIEIVVIIGYSFPYVNREIDRIIFSKINTQAVVYIQDVKDNLDQLKAKFINSMDWKGKVNQIGFVDQFFIPFEL